MSMGIALQLLFTGLGVGSIYALVALGFVLIYRATNHPTTTSAESGTALHRATRNRTTPDKLLFSCTSNCLLRYTIAPNHVSEQNSYRWCPAASVEVVRSWQL